MGRIEYLIGKSVDIRQRLLADKMSSGEFYSILHLVPTKGRVMELEADPHFWPRRRINTLTGVIHQIFEEDLRHRNYRKFKPIDDTQRYILVQRALLNRANQPDGLTFFNPIIENYGRDIDFPGVYRTIAGFFSQLVSNNYQDVFAHDMAGRMIRLEEERPGAGEERYALESDLTWLFGDYEEIKREIKGYDRDDVLSSVRTFLKEGGSPTLLAGVNAIVFDGFIQLTRIEEDILFYLFRLADGVWWPVDYDSRVEDPLNEFKNSAGREGKNCWHDRVTEKSAPIDGKEAYRASVSLVSLMDRLEEAGEESVVLKADDDSHYPNPLARGLYMDGHMEEPGKETLKIRFFGNELEEVRAIAGEIKRIIHEYELDGFRDLGKIRVIFPDLNDYSPIVSEVFSEYGIPYSLTRGLPLFSHPISNIFHDIFKIVINRFSREDIFNLFSSEPIQKILGEKTCVPAGVCSSIPEEYLLEGDSTCDPEECINMTGEGSHSGSIDIFLFDRVARRCGLNYLGDDLSEIKEGNLMSVRDFFQGRLLRIRDSGKREKLRSEYYGFIIQCGLMNHILKPFLKLANQNNPMALSDQFSSILNDLGFPENIVGLPKREINLEQDLVRSMIRRDVKAYSLLKDIISDSAREVLFAGELFKLGKGMDLLSHFYSIFKHRLKGAYLLDERDPNVIRVSQWLETRGRSFDYIFAGGMTSDKFPLKDEINFILPESGGKIFRLFDSVDLSKHLFSHLIKNYRECLYLSYPRYREERPLQPSQILVDLESMVKTNDESAVGSLEEIFRWEDNPYLTSGREMLDASIQKKGPPMETEPGLFQLKDVIVTKESSSEGLIRGINSHLSRSALDGLFEYDGQVGSAACFHEFLEDQDDTYSATQLENMANCPMGYLFEYVYGLRDMEELGPEISPIDRGDYLHAILSIFFKELRDQGKNVSEIGLIPAFSRAMKIAREYFKQHTFFKRFEFFQAQERELLEGLERDTDNTPEEGNRRGGILARLLRFEERAFMDRIPEGIEQEFGYQRPYAILGKARLRGYIDRFDLDRQDKKRVHIYDYKSGRSPSPVMVKKGLSFQLPVYIRALKSGLDNIKEISASTYSLRKEDLIKGEPILSIINDQAYGSKGLDISGVSLMDDYADQLVENIENGCFHHSADGIRCAYCEFKHACHMNSRRMDHLLDSGMDQRIYSGVKNLKRWKAVEQFRKDWKKVSESMKKAFDLKSEAGRKRHFDLVLDFKAKVADNLDHLPFHEDYIDELILEIENFEKRYGLESFN